MGNDPFISYSVANISKDILENLIACILTQVVLIERMSHIGLTKCLLPDTSTPWAPHLFETPKNEIMTSTRFIHSFSMNKPVQPLHVDVLNNVHVVEEFV